MPFSSIKDDIFRQLSSKDGLQTDIRLAVQNKINSMKARLENKKNQSIMQFKSPPIRITACSSNTRLSPVGSSFLRQDYSSTCARVVQFSSGGKPSSSQLTPPATSCLYCLSTETPFWSYSLGFPGHPLLMNSDPFLLANLTALALLESFSCKSHSHLAPWWELFLPSLRD